HQFLAGLDDRDRVEALELLDQMMEGQVVLFDAFLHRKTSSPSPRIGESVTIRRTSWDDTCRMTREDANPGRSPVAGLRLFGEPVSTIPISLRGNSCSLTPMNPTWNPHMGWGTGGTDS